MNTIVYHSLCFQLHMLRELLVKISPEAYTQQSLMLGNKTIGQHVRHVIELLQCLVAGYETGIVDYEKRPREGKTEINREYAADLLDNLIRAVHNPEKTLRLAVNDDAAGDIKVVSTGYYRELVYNTEHAIHHMALIRVALKELQLDVVDDSFGVAYATLRYQQRQELPEVVSSESLPDKRVRKQSCL
jgi:hypothetical protein